MSLVVLLVAEIYLCGSVLLTLFCSASLLRRTATHVSLPQTPSTALYNLSLATPPVTPPFILPIHVRARALLRATTDANRNLSLDGRESEKAAIEAFLSGFENNSDLDDSESVLYVSGSPGTGKTAMVNSIVNTANVLPDAKIVFINCMAISGVDVLWERLAEELIPAKPKKGVKKVQGRDGIGELLADEKCKLKWCVPHPILLEARLTI